MDLANLYRPGNPSAALLAALGLGVMQIAAVSMVQRSIVGEMQATTAAKLPNLFLIDISTDEVAGVRSLLATQPAVQGTPEIAPVISARIYRDQRHAVPAASPEAHAAPRRHVAATHLAAG